jgi:hypothetical protein
VEAAALWLLHTPGSVVKPFRNVKAALISEPNLASSARIWCCLLTVCAWLREQVAPVMHATLCYACLVRLLFDTCSGMHFDRAQLDPSERISWFRFGGGILWVRCVYLLHAVLRVHT